VTLKPARTCPLDVTGRTTMRAVAGKVVDVVALATVTEVATAMSAASSAAATARVRMRIRKLHSSDPAARRSIGCAG
jgi:hypothetical protein